MPTEITIAVFPGSGILLAERRLFMLVDES